MQPKYEFLPELGSQSFHVKRYVVASFDAPWHYHTEWELTYIIQSSGYRYVGENVAKFEEGDLVLLGPDLPHYWKNHAETSMAEAVVVQIPKESIIWQIFNAHEWQQLALLLSRASSGLCFNAISTHPIFEKLKYLASDKSGNRFLLLLEIFDLLSNIDFEVLNSQPQKNHTSLFAKAALDYIHKNFKTEISLTDISSHLNVSAPTFCRVFKQLTHKTLFEYLIQHRVNYAKRLLRETDLSISDIAFESGFNNWSNFNRQFAKLEGQNPTTYRKIQKQKMVATTGIEPVSRV